MKKLALGIATLLFAATPALACPDEAHGNKDTSVKTADKDKKQDKTAKDAKGQEKDKAAKPKTDDKTAKPKPEPTKPKDDKVSSK